MSGEYETLTKNARITSRNAAHTLLQKKDQEEPLWIEHALRKAAPKPSLWNDLFFMNPITQAVCLALLLCLMINATTMRLTAQAAVSLMDINGRSDITQIQDIQPPHATDQNV